MKPALEFTVYALKCGNCKFEASTLDPERTASAMLLHLQAVHSGPLPRDEAA